MLVATEHSWLIYRRDTVEWWERGTGWVREQRRAQAFTERDMRERTLPIGGRWVRKTDYYATVK